MSADVPDLPGFGELGLSEPALAALDAVGYEAPSPIQARTIPLLLEGRDVLGQAQTGTGKTGAFALPLIDRLDIEHCPPGAPQVLVLTPTRELAIQVAEAFQRYASRRSGFRVLPVYGGQPYATQLRPLKRGVHVVVGTPGRVMDHMRKGTLKLDGLRSMVLDEADEMLAMGFLEDVTWILEQTPSERQIALFSATMPSAVRHIVKRFLHDPAEVKMEERRSAAETIRQRYLLVPHHQKLDALTRLLEVEQVEGVLVFVRTKTATVELSEKLEARGYAAAALNGDIPQALRERTVERFKKGTLDLLVATDVAARGLDVDRISHVVNHDIPHGVDAYIHRIGRTGRAGRSGEAILFVTPRERRMLTTIERTIGRPLELMTAPSTDEVNRRRIARFKERITEVRDGTDTAFFEKLLAEYIEETGATLLDAAAALAHLVQGNQPMLLEESQATRYKKPSERRRTERRSADRAAGAGGRTSEDRAPSTRAPGTRTPVSRTPDKESTRSSGSSGAPPPDKRTPRPSIPDSAEMPEPSGERSSRSRPAAGTQRFRIDVGHNHGVKPSQIVGAIANESGLDGNLIGRIDIRADHTLVDLPEGMPPEIFKSLRKTRLCRQFLNITRARVEGDKRRGKSNQGPPGGMQPPRS